MGKKWRRGGQHPANRLGDFLPRFIIEECVQRGKFTAFAAIAEKRDCICSWSDVEVEQDLQYHDVPQEHFKTLYYCPSCGDLVMSISQHVADGGRLN